MEEKVKEIFELALKLNPRPTRRETTGEKPTVFIDFAGHVGIVWVYVHPVGWEENQNAGKTFMLDLSNPCQDIDKCIEYLNELLKESEAA